MAIGTITSPATWLLGTVVAPTWCQGIQDNINGWIAGTGPTMKSLRVDGVGGSASSQASGTIESTTTVSRTMWIPFANMQPWTAAGAVGGWTLSGTNGIVSAAVSNQVLCAIHLPFPTGGQTAAVITSVSAVVGPSAAGAMTLTVKKEAGLVALTPAISTLGSPASSSGTVIQALTVSSLTFSPTTDQYLYAAISAGQANDVIYGVSVTFATAVW